MSKKKIKRQQSLRITGVERKLTVFCSQKSGERRKSQARDRRNRAGRNGTNLTKKRGTYKKNKIDENKHQTAEPLEVLTGEGNTTNHPTCSSQGMEKTENHL